MFARSLWRIRTLVREERHFVTLHGDDAPLDDGLTVHDIEHCILTGLIVERQRDRDLGSWKYVERLLDRRR